MVSGKAGEVKTPAKQHRCRKGNYRALDLGTGFGDRLSRRVPMTCLLIRRVSLLPPAMTISSVLERESKSDRASRSEIRRVTCTRRS
jgi:hypothetical protein